MRIWSIHPCYLDTKGPVALWREGLLAQKVPMGKTQGYKHHPQLIRFKEQQAPLQALANYLHIVCDEADKRGYQFDRTKISHNQALSVKIILSSQQLKYEWQHFLTKIQKRSPQQLDLLHGKQNILPHPLFTLVDGDVADWERTKL